jgi:hypothetical protein
MKLSNGYETVLKNLKDLLEKHMLQKNIEVKKIIDIISV